MTSRSLLSVFCVLTLLYTSCVVSRKKYDAETLRANNEAATNRQLEGQIAELKGVLERRNTEIQNQKNTIADLNQRIKQLQDSIAAGKENIRDLSSRVADLNSNLNSLGSKNKESVDQLNSARALMEEQRKRLEQLQAFVDQQQKATEALRKKIADALEGFNSSELTISRKNGKVYISMQEGLLFPSGSAVVNPKGKEALSKVAAVLNTNTDINIDVEGHTDSLPIHTRQYEDNWALSTARATSIAHVLIDDYDVSPAKLVASGRSWYDPVATNGTAEGRAANRRTEIILEPRLDELMQLLNGPAPGGGK